MLVVALLLSGAAHAAPLHFSNVFGSHQVFQRGQPVAVWGWAAPHVALSATWGTERQSTTADASGMWKVVFAPRVASATPTTIVATANGETIVLEDVLVGDVVFCGGQSSKSERALLLAS